MSLSIGCKRLPISNRCFEVTSALEADGYKALSAVLVIRQGLAAGSDSGPQGSGAECGDDSF